VRHSPLALALALALALDAAAAEINWKLVLGADPAKLTPEQKARVVKILDNEFSDFGCDDTLAACLADTPQGRTARRRAGLVVRFVLNGKSDADVAQALLDRAKSVHPLKAATIVTEGRVRLGAPPDKAKVTVVEFADFQCPYCTVISPILEDLVRARKDRVAFVWKHFPVRGHERAIPAAVASEAAARQDRFWAIHDVFYENRFDLDDDDIEEYARRVGIDLARFRKDLADTSILKKIEQDKVEGLKLRVKGTPTIFINGKQYFGYKDAAELADRIEEELDIVEGRIQ
jgi:protein-disulfide isomerase